MDRSRALALVLRLTAVAFIVVFTLLFLASVTQTDTPEFLYRLFAWGDIGDAEEQMLAAVYIVWGVCLGDGSSSHATANLDSSSTPCM